MTDLAENIALKIPPLAMNYFGKPLLNMCSETMLFKHLIHVLNLFIY